MTLMITVQYSDDCPHWRLAEERLHRALAEVGRTDVQITHERVDSVAEAERNDFHGSPTVLINGRDPFRGRDVDPSLGCRIYQTEEGPQGAPSVAQLRYVLRSAV